MPLGGAHMLRSLVVRAKDKLVEKGTLKDLAHTLVTDEARVLQGGWPVLTVDNLLCLVAAALHFHETAPDLAAWSAVGVDLFLEISRIRILTL